jgi:hypothetical protein
MARSSQAQLLRPPSRRSTARQDEVAWRHFFLGFRRSSRQEPACRPRGRAAIVEGVIRGGGVRLEAAFRTPNVVTGVWRRFGVHAFEGRLSLDDMGRLESFGDLWHKKNPGSVVELAVIFPSEARMTGEERARLAKIIRRWEMSRTASATVVLASGLVGAMHRSVLTGLMMIAPAPHPTRVFGTTREAAAWLSPYVQVACGPEATPAAIGAAVDALCASRQVIGSVPSMQSTRPPT